MAAFDPRDPNFRDDFRAFMTPAQIDQSVRQAIQFCWMMMPDEKQNLDDVEKQFRRIVDRAFRDMREDRESFGLPK